MFIVRTPKKLPNIYAGIDRMIGVGMQVGANEIAEEVKKTIVNGFNTKPKSHKSTGQYNKSEKLSDAVHILPYDMSSISYARRDVYVDAKEAPHVFWIEYGKKAPLGLPYSNTEDPKKFKDFKKSKFNGYWIIDGAVKYHNSKRSADKVKEMIFKSFQTKSLLKGLGGNITEVK